MSDIEYKLLSNMPLFDEIELEDMSYNKELEIWFYPCPCGSKFQFTKLDKENGEEFALCPDCSLYIRVIY